LMEIRVGLGSTSLLAAYQREYHDHDNSNEGNAANSYSNDGPR
jgi:hypothetical protein